eukprot:Rhum_TRINITY_DN18595_c0_g1::Rhum_TRINITY_DN18595_c0_g1_i1::g.167777::m.167777
MWRVVARTSFATLFVAAVAAGQGSPDDWKSLRSGLEAWEDLTWGTEYSLSTGDTKGGYFVHSAGKQNMNYRMLGASLSKWPAAAAIASTVARGVMRWDDRPSKYLDWWTTDPSDSRSNVTLYSLLTFTSGYLEDAEVKCASKPDGDFVPCVKDLYNAVPHNGVAGRSWAYLSCHLQFAGAMAAAATKLRPDLFFKEYLYRPLGMNLTTWGEKPYYNPQFATGITTTGNDYEHFLKALLEYTWMKKDIVDRMELDATAPPIGEGSGWFGHYSLGHWYECMGFGTGASSLAVLPLRCRKAQIHSCPGAFAYYPVIDRSREMFFQVATQEVEVKTGIPEYLRIIAKPVADLILEGRDPASVNREEILRLGGGLLLRDLTYINGEVNPSSRAKYGQRSDAWASLVDGLEAWAALNWTTDFSFNVGTASGPLFTHQVGSTSMDTKVLGASLSKWPAACMISKAVAEGYLSFDDKPSKYLKWWTTNPNDTRSAVTLAHLLSFTSGYEEDAEVACANDPSGDYLACAQQLYEKLKHTAPSGTTFTYLSCHLQLAGAMASAATGLPIKKMFSKFLYSPLGMGNTTWGTAPYENPQMATGIKTTGNDFERLLRGLLDNSYLPSHVTSVMERDWTAPPVSPQGDGWFGNYAMGHWFECIGYGTGRAESEPIPQRCRDEAIQAGPGAYAYYPLIDRKRGYYMQVVLQESYKKSGIPEYLRIVTKPVVDQIVEGTDPADVNRHDLLGAGGGLILRDLAYIQQSL